MAKIFHNCALKSFFMRRLGIPNEYSYKFRFSKLGFELNFKLGVLERRGIKPLVLGDCLTPFRFVCLSDAPSR